MEAPIGLLLLLQLEAFICSLDSLLDCACSLDGEWWKTSKTKTRNDTGNTCMSLEKRVVSQSSSLTFLLTIPWQYTTSHTQWGQQPRCVRGWWLAVASFERRRSDCSSPRSSDVRWRWGLNIKAWWVHNRQIANQGPNLQYLVLQRIRTSDSGCHLRFSSLDFCQ